MSLRRASAGLLALVILAALGVRIALNMETNGFGPGEALWGIFRYFTIWTNFLIAMVAALIAGGRHVDGRVSGGLVLAIIAVGIVYHLLLAGQSDYTGVELVIDHVFHTIAPIWFPLHWLAFEPKERVNWRTLPVWLVYPAVYCLYALLRGLVDGVFPYFFLDPGAQGLVGLGLWMAALLAAFAVVGSVIIAVARSLSADRLPPAAKVE